MPLEPSNFRRPVRLKLPPSTTDGFRRPVAKPADPPKPAAPAPVIARPVPPPPPKPPIAPRPPTPIAPVRPPQSPAKPPTPAKKLKKSKRHHLKQFVITLLLLILAAGAGFVANSVATTHSLNVLASLRHHNQPKPSTPVHKYCYYKDSTTATPTCLPQASCQATPACAEVFQSQNGNN